MPLLIPEGYAQASIEMRAEGDADPWYVTFGVSLAAISGDPEDLAPLVYNAWSTNWVSHQADFVSTTACILAIGAAGGVAVRVRYDETVEGAGTAAQLPQNCALLVHKNSARGGHRGRGRFYVPGVLQESLVNGIGLIDSGERTSLQSAATGFWDDLSTLSPMVILHNDGGETAAGDPDVVTSLSVDPIIATQRGRLRR